MAYGSMPFQTPTGPAQLMGQQQPGLAATLGASGPSPSFPWNPTPGGYSLLGGAAKHAAQVSQLGLSPPWAVPMPGQGGPPGGGGQGGYPAPVPRPPFVPFPQPPGEQQPPGMMPPPGQMPPGGAPPAGPPPQTVQPPAVGGPGPTIGVPPAGGGNVQGAVQPPAPGVMYQAGFSGGGGGSPAFGAPTGVGSQYRMGKQTPGGQIRWTYGVRT